MMLFTPGAHGVQNRVWLVNNNIRTLQMTPRGLLSKVVHCYSTVLYADAVCVCVCVYHVPQR